MRRIASGTTDQYVYFQRQTGLSSFTVYRSRNGAAWAAMTTPTISEGSSGNAPGIYQLLLDEDMTIGSGNTTEHMVFYITASDMTPVFLEVELFRPVITEGQTLTVASSVASANVTQFGGSAGAFASGRPEVNVNSLAANSITAAATAADFSTEVNAAVLAVLGALNDSAADGAVTTTDTIVAYMKQIINTLEGAPGIPSFPSAASAGNGVSMAEVLRAISERLGVPSDLGGGASVAANLSDIEGQTDNLPSIETKIDTLDTVADAIKVTTDRLDDTLEDQGGGTFGFTEAALQEAPTGEGGGGTDWDADERTAIRSILGIPGSGTTPADPSTGILDTIRDAVATRASQTSVDDVPTNAELAAAIAGGDDAVLAAIAALNNVSVASILAATVEGSTTLVHTLRLLNAALGGKASGLATTTAVYRDLADSKNRISATVDADGNRSAVTLDLT